MQFIIGPDTPPQALGRDNMALDKIVRLGWVGLMEREEF